MVSPSIQIDGLPTMGSIVVNIIATIIVLILFLMFVVFLPVISMNTSKREGVIGSSSSYGTRTYYIPRL